MSENDSTTWCDRCAMNHEKLSCMNCDKAHPAPDDAYHSGICACGGVFTLFPMPCPNATKPGTLAAELDETRAAVAEVRKDVQPAIAAARDAAADARAAAAAVRKSLGL